MLMKTYIWLCLAAICIGAGFAYADKFFTFIANY